MVYFETQSIAYRVLTPEPIIDNTASDHPSASRGIKRSILLLASEVQPDTMDFKPLDTPPKAYTGGVDYLLLSEITVCSCQSS